MIIKTSIRHRQTVAVSMMLVLVPLSLAPGDPQPGDSAFVWLVDSVPSFTQNLMHLVCYGLLAMLWYWSLASIEARIWRMAVAFAIAASFGSLLEWFQLFVPGRFSTVTDAGLNLLGALAGMLLCALYSARSDARPGVRERE